MKHPFSFFGGGKRPQTTESSAPAALTSFKDVTHIVDWLRQARGGKPIAIFPDANEPRPPLTRATLYTKHSRVRSPYAPSACRVPA
jgi:hypothetical protein